MQPKFSVVIPIYNEQECINELISRLKSSLKDSQHEVIFVNDGSTDKSDSMVRQSLSAYDELRYISLSRNKGQSAAVYCGFQHAKGKYIVMMDADLQNRPEDIMSLVNEADKGYDLVSGRRKGRKEGFVLRRLPSLTANLLIRKVTGSTVKDMGGFKCIKADIAKSIPIKSGYHRLLPALVHTIGGSCTEVDVEHEPRFAGTSKYGTISRMIDVIFDIVLLWFLNASKARPLYLFGKLSLIQFLIASLSLSYLSVSKFILGEDIGSRPLFFVSLALLFTSIITLVTALLAELILEIKHTANSDRPYKIKYLNRRPG